MFFKILIEPESGKTSLRINFRNVVLPEPFFPKIPILSFFLILILNLSKILISFSVFLKDLLTLYNSAIDFECISTSFNGLNTTLEVALRNYLSSSSSFFLISFTFSSLLTLRFTLAFTPLEAHSTSTAMLCFLFLNSLSS